MGRRKQLNLGGKQKLRCRNNQGKGGGRGRGEGRVGKRPKPKPFLGGRILYCQAPALGRKVVGYYADASLKPSESPPLATKYEPISPQLHTTT